VTALGGCFRPRCLVAGQGGGKGSGTGICCRGRSSPQCKGVWCSDCTGDRVLRSLVARAPALQGRAQEQEICYLLLCPAPGVLRRDICPPATQGTQGTAVTHLDDWCGMRAHPEPAEPCPISPRRKVLTENRPAQRSKEEMIPGLEQKMSFPGLLPGEGGCLAAAFPHGVILS